MLNEEIYVDTGNTAITSIINYYIEEAKKKGINVSTHIIIPDKVNIETYDLSAILINLLQNAIEALEKCHSSKKLNINLIFQKNILYIMIENSNDNSSLKSEEDLKTTKTNKNEHGFGLQSVRNSIEKYNGEMQFVFHKDKIQTFVMLYNVKDENNNV